MRRVRISVRRLVEFVRRSGSIDNRMTNSDRALEGTKIHQLLQKEAGEEYAAEVRLNLERIVDGIAFSLDGRADGIINSRMIDEIKTTETPMDEITEDFRPLHWAQLICYGFMLAEKSDLAEVTLQLTYYQVVDKKSKTISTCNESRGTECFCGRFTFPICYLGKGICRLGNETK